MNVLVKRRVENPWKTHNRNYKIEIVEFLWQMFSLATDCETKPEENSNRKLCRSINESDPEVLKRLPME